MKKNQSTLLLVCGVVITLGVCLVPRFLKDQPKAVHYSQERPHVPATLSQEKKLTPEMQCQDLLHHPWVASQPGIQALSPGIVRDIWMLGELWEFMSAEAKKIGKKPMSQDELTTLLVSTLKNLQSSIPFAFPSECYNVLCISETPQHWYPAPIPFQVYQRLYLDETDLGLPFYLDVRVFELESASEEDQVEQIIAWHLSTLEESPDAFTTYGNNVYIGRGHRTPTEDLSHGFASLQGERGVYLHFIRCSYRLYVAYADAPWPIFEKHRSLFDRLIESVHF